MNLPMLVVIVVGAGALAGCQADPAQRAPEAIATVPSVTAPSADATPADEAEGSNEAPLLKRHHYAPALSHRHLRVRHAVAR